MQEYLLEVLLLYQGWDLPPLDLGEHGEQREKDRHTKEDQKQQPHAGDGEVFLSHTYTPTLVWMEVSFSWICWVTNCST